MHVLFFLYKETTTMPQNFLPDKYSRKYNNRGKKTEQKYDGQKFKQINVI